MRLFAVTWLSRHDHLPCAAKFVEVIDVEATQGRRQSLENSVNGHAQRLGFFTVHIDKNLRYIRPPQRRHKHEHRVLSELVNELVADLGQAFDTALTAGDGQALNIGTGRGISVNEIFSTLQVYLGSLYINDFNKFGRTWQVIMSAEPSYRKQPQDIAGVYVRSERGEMVPLSSLAQVRFESGPETMERFNNLPSVKILGSGLPGFSSSQVNERLEAIAKETLPPDFSYDWGGASYQEKHTGDSSTIALGLGALMVFLILAAQYERWSLPFAVLLALPFGTFGALAAVWMRHFTNDVYFQIGLVTLLGLAAKNAILIVEYASHKRQDGMSAAGAAIEAARLRFRPILMTSLAFILGVLPLALSVGAGAGARQSVGTGVVGGMLAATFLAIFFVPLFYRVITDRKLREPRSKAELYAEVQEHHELTRQKIIAAAAGEKP